MPLHRFAVRTLVPALLVVASIASPLGSQVPRAITDLGNHGEDLYDAITASRWTAARAIGDSLAHAAGAVRFDDARLAPQRAPLAAQLDTLHSAISRRDRFAALEAANQVTYLAAIMTRPFAPQPPADIALLDFQGRELEIWAARRDMTRLHRTAASLRATWNAARPLVEARGGAAAALVMERNVARVERARTPAEFHQAAGPVLDQVDVLERVFEK